MLRNVIISPARLRRPRTDASEGRPPRQVEEIQRQFDIFDVELRKLLLGARQFKGQDSSPLALAAPAATALAAHRSDSSLDRERSPRAGVDEGSGASRAFLPRAIAHDLLRRGDAARGFRCEELAGIDVA